jgi:hypothetical protein
VPGKKENQSHPRVPRTENKQSGRKGFLRSVRGGHVVENTGRNIGLGTDDRDGTRAALALSPGWGLTNIQSLDFLEARVREERESTSST